MSVFLEMRKPILLQKVAFLSLLLTKIASFWTTTMRNKADIWKMAKIIEQLYRH